MKTDTQELRETLKMLRNEMRLGQIPRARFEWIMAKAFEVLELIEIGERNPPPVINGRFTVIQGDRP
jgi:hypothetical protein